MAALVETASSKCASACRRPRSGNEVFEAGDGPVLAKNHAPRLPVMEKEILAVGGDGAQSFEQGFSPANLVPMARAAAGGINQRHDIVWVLLRCLLEQSNRLVEPVLPPTGAGSLQCGEISAQKRISKPQLGSRRRRRNARIEPARIAVSPDAGSGTIVSSREMLSMYPSILVPPGVLVSKATNETDRAVAGTMPVN
jgi:hypothetical protein